MRFFNDDKINDHKSTTTNNTTPTFLSSSICKQTSSYLLTNALRRSEECTNDDVKRCCIIVFVDIVRAVEDQHGTSSPGRSLEQWSMFCYQRSIVISIYQRASFRLSLCTRHRHNCSMFSMYAAAAAAVNTARYARADFIVH